jgi:hypothetical protein
MYSASNDKKDLGGIANQDVAETSENNNDKNKNKNTSVWKNISVWDSTKEFPYEDLIHEVKRSPRNTKLTAWGCPPVPVPPFPVPWSALKWKKCSVWDNIKVVESGDLIRRPWPVTTKLTAWGCPPVRTTCSPLPWKDLDWDNVPAIDRSREGRKRHWKEEKTTVVKGTKLVSKKKSANDDILFVIDRKGEPPL